MMTTRPNTWLSPSTNANISRLSLLRWTASSIPTLQPSDPAGPANPSTYMPASKHETRLRQSQSHFSCDETRRPRCALRRPASFTSFSPGAGAPATNTTAPQRTNKTAAPATNINITYVVAIEERERRAILVR